MPYHVDQIIIMIWHIFIIEFYELVVQPLWLSFLRNACFDRTWVLLERICTVQWFLSEKEYL